MAIWNPWKGCHRKSEGCQHCYIHRANEKKGINTDIIYKTEEFHKPVQKDKKGNYKVKGGQTVYICFNSDFLIEEADEWRKEAWEMIIERRDLNFLFITKRIERFKLGFPEYIQNDLDNVTVCISVENQQRADERIPFLKELPIKHKMIIIQPMLEKIDISDYLDNTIESVVVGGESGSNVRPLYYDWVLDIKEQCIKKNVNFDFRQVGSTFIKDGVTYKVQRQYLCAQARKAGINFRAENNII